MAVYGSTPAFIVMLGQNSWSGHVNTVPRRRLPYTFNYKDFKQDQQDKIYTSAHSAAAYCILHMHVNMTLSAHTRGGSGITVNQVLPGATL